MDNLHTLVYLSNSSHPFSDTDLNDILAVSRKNNSEKNISGILIYCDGNILQVLEGEHDAIHSLYRKIEFDLRHKDLIILQDTPLTERNFADWSMGFKPATKEQFAQLEGYFDLRTQNKVEGDTLLTAIVNDFIVNNK
jgi:hypothetical protein